VLDLRRAIAEFEHGRPKRGQGFRGACMESVKHFTWERSALAILGALEPIIRAAQRPGVD
jgi:hypothetical protein